MYLGRGSLPNLSQDFQMFQKYQKDCVQPTFHTEVLQAPTSPPKKSTPHHEEFQELCNLAFHRKWM